MLNDAINQVREDVLNGIEFNAAVQQAAADFSLNPALVTRKFQEKHGSADAVKAAIQAVSAAAQKDAEREEARIVHMCSFNDAFGLWMRAKYNR